METANLSRPAAHAAAPSPAPRTEHVAREAVKTDLAPVASVQQASKVEPVKLGLTPGFQKRAAVEQAFSTLQRNVTIDPASHQVVIQKVDAKTREVVQQFPDEKLLRIRAHMREVEKRASEQSEGVKAVDQIA